MAWLVAESEVTTSACCHHHHHHHHHHHQTLSFQQHYSAQVAATTIAEDSGRATSTERHGRRLMGFQSLEQLSHVQ